MDKPELLGLTGITLDQLFSKIADTERLLTALKHELVRRCRPDLEDPVLRRRRELSRTVPRKIRPAGTRLPPFQHPAWRD
ncbi:hypothetical protein [Roseicella frigidaeris]|uniref:Uncharacterized protein n=1 Tax=Roseicella frigidaeris TaxID=2230885 RepID=A0A327M0W7_9PROT|nr:hypothetical protein [Roseicella frigidaeris]RAI55935.1 hypothetical protein DOO78_23605 [Roseicella frigidaeris]